MMDGPADSCAVFGAVKVEWGRACGEEGAETVTKTSILSLAPGLGAYLYPFNIVFHFL